MFEWERFFEPKILDRGWRYACEGAVEHIVKTDKTIEAIVEGSEYYKVVLECDGQTISKAYCSCPYAAKGYNCKHMAAVLYAIDTEDSLTPDMDRECDVSCSDIVETNGRSVPVPIGQLISEAEHEELASILLNMALEDERIESHIRSALAKKRMSINSNDLKWEIDSLFNTYTYKGYIDYKNAFAFANDLEEYLENTTAYLLKHKNYLEAFDLSMYAFVRLGNCDIDDDGEISQISHVCYRIWQRIIAECPADVRGKIDDWFAAHSDDGTVIDFMEYVLQDFQKYELASEKQLMEELEELDRIIDDCREKTWCNTVYTTFYGYNIEAIDLRIILMRRLGASEEDVEQFRQKYMNFRSVRSYYLKKAQEEGDVEKEIALLQMGKQMDRDEPYFVHTYAQRLADLYHKTNDFCKEKAERREDLLTYPISKIDDYRSYCEMCTEEEWEKERMLIIESQCDINRKCELLAEEQLYDKLLEIVLQEEQEERIAHLDQYGFLLAGEYSKEILNAYRKYVSEIASYARNRANYESLIRYLMRMKQYKGGNELVEKLCRKWIERYPTRKVMVEELSRLI